MATSFPHAYLGGWMAKCFPHAYLGGWMATCFPHAYLGGWMATCFPRSSGGWLVNRWDFGCLQILQIFSIFVLHFICSNYLL